MKIHVTRWALAVAVMLLLVGSFGCVSKGANTSGKESNAPAKESSNVNQDTKKKELTKVRAAQITPKGNVGFFQMAQHKGFYEEEGIEVEYSFIETAPNIIKAVIAGEIDIAEINPGLMIEAIAGGDVKAKIIGSGLSGLSYYIYARNDIQSAKDMEGRIGGTSQSKSFLDEMMTLWMLAEGADPNRITRVNAGGSAASFQALLAGKVDATAAGPEYLTIAEEHPDLHLVADLTQVLPKYMNFGIITSERMLEERRPDVLAFMKAHAKGYRYAIEHPEEMMALSAEILKIDPQDPGLQLVYDTNVHNRLISPNLDITPDQIEYMIESRVAMGGLGGGKPTVEEVADFSIGREVVAELGEFQWPD